MQEEKQECESRMEERRGKGNSDKRLDLNLQTLEMTDVSVYGTLRYQSVLEKHCLVAQR